MSLWYCPEHGLIGPMACCSSASRAELSEPPLPPAEFRLTDSHPRAIEYPVAASEPREPEVDRG